MLGQSTKLINYYTNDLIFGLKNKNAGLERETLSVKAVREKRKKDHRRRYSLLLSLFTVVVATHSQPSSTKADYL